MSDATAAEDSTSQQQQQQPSPTKRDKTRADIARDRRLATMENAAARSRDLNDTVETRQFATALNREVMLQQRTAYFKNQQAAKQRAVAERREQLRLQSYDTLNYVEQRCALAATSSTGKVKDGFVPATNENGGKWGVLGRPTGASHGSHARRKSESPTEDASSSAAAARPEAGAARAATRLCSPRAPVYVSTVHTVATPRAQNHLTLPPLVKPASDGPVPPTPADPEGQRLVQAAAQRALAGLHRDAQQRKQAPQRRH